ncbi:WRC domain [Sesbania bispinosa]|nr:WRC domain [Sesbania bispinosa]
MREKDVPGIEPPDELRCRRTDGRSWRCRHWRIHDQRYCEVHYLSNRSKSFHCPKSMNSKASASPAKDVDEEEEARHKFVKVQV